MWILIPTGILYLYDDKINLEQNKFNRVERIRWNLKRNIVVSGMSVTCIVKITESLKWSIAICT